MRAGSPLRAYGDLPARPWFLIPPLHIVADPGAEVLTMYTIQTRDAYETLQRSGVLVGDSSHADTDWIGVMAIREAYDWMHRQMDVRMPGSPDRGLLWLWPTATHALLRDCARRCSGEVFLTVHVRRARVLLSEFGDWNIVLNRGLNLPQEAGESELEYEQCYTALDDDFDSRAEPYRSAPITEWPVDLRAEMESSWEAIFDPASWRPKRLLQATVREIRAADVVRAVRIR